MANSSALPFPIPSGGEDVVPLDEGIRFCGSLCTKPKGLELRKGPKTWCKGNGGIRFCGSLCTRSEGLELRKGPRTWCKGNGGTGVCGDSCTKSEGLELRKGPKTWCKRNEGTRFCGDSCTKSEAAELRTAGSDVGNPPLGVSSGPDSLLSCNERSRCIKCTAASLIAYIGRLGMRTVKVVPLPGMLST